jgi:restriction endonuclease S subunit
LYTTYTYFIRASKAFIRAERASGYTPIQYGDVLFAASGETIEEIGKSAVNLMQTAAVCGGDVIVLRPSIPVHAPFLGYAMDCRPATNQKATMGRGTTVKHIYPDELRSLLFPLPTLDEQVAIVRFLDWANGRLERAVRAKRKVIALLNEQKQAIIHRAVTRGLDPSVPLKPSGIPWLGEIPAHWDVFPLRGLLAERKEKNDPIKTNNILSLSLHAGVIPYADKKPGGNKAKGDLSAYMLAYPGDIVLNSMNVVVGSVGLSKYFGAVSPVYYMLHPRHGDDLVEFFDAIFQAGAFQRSLFGLGNGIMVIQSKSTGQLNTIRLRIPMTKLRRVQLPYPGPKEQAAIIEYIAQAKSHFDNAINTSLQELNLLREYRTRLVADVVTGKLDVREAARNLPEDTEAPATIVAEELAEETESIEDEQIV